MNPHTRPLVLISAFAVLLLSLPACREAPETDSANRRSRAWDLFQQGEYDLSLREFTQLRAEIPAGSTLHQETLFAEAQIWHMRPQPRKNRPLAESLYQQAIAADPQSDLAAWSWMGLARIHILPVGGESVPVATRVKAYQELVDRFPRHPAGQEAFLLQQAALFELNTPETYDAIIRNLFAFMEDQPDSPWLPNAWSMVAACARRTHDHELRLRALRTSLAMQKGDPLYAAQDQSGLIWDIATTAHFDLADFETAREYYRLFIAGYPTQQRVFLAKQALARMDDIETALRNEIREKQKEAL